ncbi:MAG: DUF2339 domain-containing protein [Actinomycetota bacterium]|nr:DUF2339 domain-containing protein [Actinomycetota bacterium]
MNEAKERPNGSAADVPALPLFGPSIEDSVVGTWFARIGVLALLIGAAFGYRYAVDQGLIGPAARVALGALTGFALVGLGHWARSRQWFNFAHAISGGGVAILYLSVLAAQFRFDLISPALALTLLSGVALLSAWLALGYDSLPLAILATLGAFMNPFFLAADDPTGAMSYVVGVDLAVVGLAFHRSWPSLNKLALAGTVLIVMLVANDVSGAIEGLGFTTVLWVLFSVIPFVQVLRDRQTIGPVDAGLVVSVAFLFLAAGIYFLEDSGPVAVGLFSLATGAGYAAMAGLAYADARTRPVLSGVLGALAVGFVTLAAPLMVDGPTVHLIWAIEGAVLLYVAGAVDHVGARLAAGALVLAGVVGTVDVLSDYAPERLFFTPAGASIALQIVVLYASAWVAAKGAMHEELRVWVVRGLLVLANLLTLAWLSAEARAAIHRSPEFAMTTYPTTQFVLSGLWAGYSAGLIAVGVWLRQRWARYLGLATFALTLIKMVTVDLWQLETLQRTMAFVGLGVLMIACSFLYNRFRDIIAGTET